MATMLLANNISGSATYIRDATFDAYSTAIFIPSGVYDIEYIVIRTGRNNPSSTLTVGIWNFSLEGGPTSLVGSVNVDVSSWGTDDHIITFNEPIHVSGGYYAIVLSGDDQASGVWWLRDGTNGASGEAWRHRTSDGKWFSLSSSQFDFQVWVTDTDYAPYKPTNPTPANAATEVDFSGFTLSWVDGGGADTYNVYIGPSGNLVGVSMGQAGTSYVTNMDEVPYNQIIYWRVDAVNDTGTTEGDTWHFDARPGKPINPTPVDTGTDIKLGLTKLTWKSGS